MARPHPPPGAIAALALLALIWGYNWVVTKIALGYAGALDFAALRTLLGAVSLFAALRVLGRPLRPPPWRDVIVLGALQTTAFLGLSVWALIEGGAGQTAVLVYTMPFWVALIAWPVLAERVRDAGPIVLAFAGLMLILAPWSWHGSLLSKLLAIFAGIAWAASVIYAKTLRGRPDLLSLTAWQMLLGALPLAAAALAMPGREIEWSPQLAGALVFNIASSLGWVLWLYVLQKLPAGAASMGTLATPVVGALSAWLQLGEQPTVDEGAGMVMVGAALAWLSILALRQHRRVQAAMAQE